MILKNKEQLGGDSRVVQVEGVVTVLAPQQRIRVGDDYEYNKDKFDKLEKQTKPERPPK